jgi:hypothetical protein
VNIGAGETRQTHIEHEETGRVFSTHCNPSKPSSTALAISSADPQRAPIEGAKRGIILADTKAGAFHHRATNNHARARRIATEPDRGSLYSLPSFSLSLDHIRHDLSNSFPSNAHVFRGTTLSALWRSQCALHR